MKFNEYESVDELARSLLSFKRPLLSVRKDYSMENGEGRKYEVWVDRELGGMEEGICAMT